MTWAFQPILPAAAHQQSDPFSVSLAEAAAAVASQDATVSPPGIMVESVTAADSQGGETPSIINEKTTQSPGNAYIGETMASNYLRYAFSTDTSAVIAMTGFSEHTDGSGMTSSTYGYYMGGSSGEAAIDRLAFASETPSTSGTTLAFPRYQAITVGTVGTGYICGGYRYSPAGAIDDVRSFVYDTETMSYYGASLDSLYRACGLSGVTNGYKLGGYSVYVSSISTMVYSTGTWSSVTDTLSSTRAQMGGFENVDATIGYTAGGRNASSQNTIDRFVFSTETCDALSATLSVARLTRATFASEANGYAFGGGVGSYEVDGLQFSDETAINPTAALAYYYSVGIATGVKVINGVYESQDEAPAAPSEQAVESFTTVATQESEHLINYASPSTLWESVSARGEKIYLPTKYLTVEYMHRLVTATDSAASIASVMPGLDGSCASMANASTGYAYVASSSVWGYTFASETARVVSSGGGTQSYQKQAGASAPFNGYVIGGLTGMSDITRKFSFATETDASTTAHPVTGMYFSAAYDAVTNSLWMLGGQTVSGDPVSTAYYLPVATEVWSTELLYLDAGRRSAGAAVSYNEAILMGGSSTQRVESWGFVFRAGAIIGETLLASGFDDPAASQSTTHGYAFNSSGGGAKVAFGSYTHTNLPGLIPGTGPQLAAFSATAGIAATEDGVVPAILSGVRDESMTASATQVASFIAVGTRGEALSAAETVTAALLAVAARLEAGSLADTQDRSNSLFGGAPEGVTVSEVEGAVASFLGVMPETVAAGDSSSTGTVVVDARVESFSSGDVQSIIYGAFGGQLETLAAADAPAATFVAVAVRAEAGSAMEGTSAVLVQGGGCTEAATLVDSVAGAATLFVDKTVVLALVASAIGSTGGGTGTVGEYATLSASVSAHVPGPVPASLDEAAGLADAVRAVASMVVDRMEAGGAADTLTGAVRRHASAADAVTAEAQAYSVLSAVSSAAEAVVVEVYETAGVSYAAVGVGESLVLGDVVVTVTWLVPEAPAGYVLVRTDTATICSRAVYITVFTKADRAGVAEVPESGIVNTLADEGTPRAESVKAVVRKGEA